MVEPMAMQVTAPIAKKKCERDMDASLSGTMDAFLV
jgi:hypothetical protein